MKFIFIAAGGAVGALLRYAVSGLAQRSFEGVFPWGTLSVNLIGSFFIGFLGGIFERFTAPPNLKIFILIGLLGAFTTFSTFSFENFNLFRDGEIKLALSNILISNFFGIALVFAGFIASRFIIDSFK